MSDRVHVIRGEIPPGVSPPSTSMNPPPVSDLRERMVRALTRWHADRATICDHTCTCGQDGAIEAVMAIVQPEIDDHEQAISGLNTTVTKLEKRAAGWRQRAEQAEAAIRQVRKLHERYRFAGDDTTDYCTECNRLSGGWVPYPCPTLQALDQPKEG